LSINSHWQGFNETGRFASGNGYGKNRFACFKLFQTRYHNRMKKRSLGWMIIALLLTIAGVGLYSFGLRAVYRHWGYFFLKPSGTQWPAGSRERIRELTGDRKGKVAWSSSRTGTHQLYLMTFPDLRIYQLTDHPHVSYYPRFSPEGGRIVFARSQRPWVSEREQAPWDVYILSLAGGKERLAAKNGNFPLWLPDGERILFVRKDEVVIKDLHTEKEKVIFDGREPPFNGEPSTPEMCPWNPDLITFTLRGKEDGVFILDLKTKRRILVSASGCESTWSPDRREIVWVQNGGRGGTRIMASPADRVQGRVFMDLPFSFSHEYFPRFSADGKWFTWGASEGGHEHDIADYELFLWKVGRPWETAVRLTYSPANDRFPDIYFE
jgi:Tol biopolymer transport system component